MLRFITQSRTLLNRIAPQTGDAARLAHRLSIALDQIEHDRAVMRAAYNDIMKRYDVQAANRLAYQLTVDPEPPTPYEHAMEESRQWKAKAEKGCHPGRGFCLNMAEKWEDKARALLQS